MGADNGQVLLFEAFDEGLEKSLVAIPAEQGEPLTLLAGRDRVANDIACFLHYVDVRVLAQGEHSIVQHFVLQELLDALRPRSRQVAHGPKRFLDHRCFRRVRLLQKKLVDLVCYKELYDSAVVCREDRANVLQRNSADLLILMAQQLKHLENYDLVRIEMVDASAGIDVLADLRNLSQRGCHFPQLHFKDGVLLITEELQ